MGARRKSREYALQALYLIDITNLTPEKVLRGVLHGENVDPKVKQFAEVLTQGTLDHKQDLDQLIVKHTKNWDMNRMAVLDRNILRLGTYEILHLTDTPISVIIDEAVEIAKEYSTDDSGKFVNGILDKIKSERPHEKG